MSNPADDPAVAVELEIDARHRATFRRIVAELIAKSSQCANARNDLSQRRVDRIERL
jgi:hypothetical protein